MRSVTDGSTKELNLTKEKSQNKKKYFYIATANEALIEFVKFVFHEPGKENSPFIILEMMKSRKCMPTGMQEAQLDHL